MHNATVIPRARANTGCEKVLLFLKFAFGLLPFYGTQIVIIWESDGSSEYWSAAPWFLFLAAPACLVTFLIAEITGSVYNLTPGSAKLKATAACLAFAFCLAAPVAAVVYIRSQ